MSPPDSEGKCQCQHCDGKQSVRECLCDSEGVTSTMDKPKIQRGNKKSGNFLTIQPALSGVEAVSWQTAGWWGFSISNTTRQFWCWGREKEKHSKDDNYLPKNYNEFTHRAKLIWSLEVKIKEKMTINTCLPDFTIYCLEISWSPVNNILL